MAHRLQTPSTSTRTPAQRPARRTHAKSRPGNAATTPKEDRVTDIAPQDREQMIATAAYFRAQMRGFEPGGELQDWLEAETEVDLLISR
jgi:hypothetical protein